jgi:tetratricopeptide (TPR) repeat protein
MAMRKEPQRRYASAEQFADDLRRYLEGQPVRAHRDSLAYRAAKFVRRNRTAVAAGLVLALAMVAGVIGTTSGLILARRERDRAEDSSRQARQAVNQFFTRVSEERLLNQPGLHTLRKTLLLDAQHFYENFLNQRGSDRDPALRAELAAAKARVAKITGDIDSPARAAEVYQQAIALWEKLVAADPGNPAHKEELADTLNGLGVTLLRQQGRLDEALHAFRRAQDLIEPLVAAKPQSASLRHELALVLNNIALIRQDQGHPDQAIEILHRVLPIESQLAQEHPGALNSRITLAETHALLGRLLMEQPEGLQPAMESYQRAIEILDSMTREHPELADQSNILAMDLSDLGILQQTAGKLDSALQSMNQAREIMERLDRQYPNVLSYQDVLASTQNMLSDLHRRRGEPAEALAFAQKAKALLERLLSQNPADLNLKIYLSKSYNNMGRLLQQAGEPPDALKSFQHAVDLLESLPQLDPRESYNLACNLALCIPLIGAPNGSQGTLDTAGLSKDAQARRQQYGTRAMQVLRRATSGGFINSEFLQSDSDLDPLRDRGDFKDLLKEIDSQSKKSP